MDINLSPITYQRHDGRANVNRTVTVTRERPAWWKHLIDLNRLGLSDGEIGAALGVKGQTVWKARKTLGLPRNYAPNGVVEEDEQ